MPVEGTVAVREGDLNDGGSHMKLFRQDRLLALSIEHCYGYIIVARSQVRMAYVLALSLVPITKVPDEQDDVHFAYASSRNRECNLLWRCRVNR